jgi:hypothetical protein
MSPNPYFLSKLKLILSVKKVVKMSYFLQKELKYPPKKIAKSGHPAAQSCIDWLPLIIAH